MSGKQSMSVQQLVDDRNALAARVKLLEEHNANLRASALYDQHRYKVLSSEYHGMLRRMLGEE